MKSTWPFVCLACRSTPHYLHPSVSDGRTETCLHFTFPLKCLLLCFHSNIIIWQPALSSRKLQHSHLWTPSCRDTDLELASVIQVGGHHQCNLLLSPIISQDVVFSPLTPRWSHFTDIWSFLFKLFFNLVHSPPLITHSCSCFIFLSAKPAPPLICLHIPPRNLPHSPLDSPINFVPDDNNLTYIPFKTIHAHCTSMSYFFNDIEATLSP